MIQSWTFDTYLSLVVMDLTMDKACKDISDLSYAHGRGCWLTCLYLQAATRHYLVKKKEVKNI